MKPRRLNTAPLPRVSAWPIRAPVIAVVVFEIVGDAVGHMLTAAANDRIVKDVDDRSVDVGYQDAGATAPHRPGAEELAPPRITPRDGRASGAGAVGDRPSRATVVLWRAARYIYVVGAALSAAFLSCTASGP